MKFKHFVVLMLCVVLVATIGLLACDYMGLVPRTSGRKVVMSVWGDSIAEGVLGASPIQERDYYTYCQVVGQRNEFEFHNRSVSGHTTGQFYEYITRTGVFEDEKNPGIDNGPMMTGTLLRSSDVIGISMLGNDLLNKPLGDWLEKMAEGDRSELDAAVAKTKVKFYAAMDYIKEVNPKALVLMQTVYNPIFEGTLISQNFELVLSEERIARLREKGVGTAGIRTSGAQMLNALNGILHDYLKDHPGAFEIVDVYTEFDRIYNEDPVRGKALLYTDGIHPSNEGHAVIGDLYQKALEKHGLANKQRALISYKRMRSNQLDRLFGQSDLDLKAIKKDLGKAKSCQEVTNVYFRAIDGVTPVCGELPNHKNTNGEYLPESNERYYLTDNCTVNPGVELPVAVFLKERSFIELSADGTITIELRLPKGTNIAGIIDSLAGSVDFSEIDLTVFAQQYLYSLFPGFTLDDIEKSIGLIKDNVGLEIEGLDFEYKGMQEISRSLRETRRLPSKLDLDPNMDLCIRYTGEYTLKKVKSPITGVEYEQINIDKYPDGGDSYIIGCRDIDPETGKQRIYFRIDFLWMYAEAVQK